MRELIFTLPDAIKPVSANIHSGRGHWGKAYQAQKRFQRDASLVLKSQWHRDKMKPLTPPVKLYITYLFKKQSGRDLDNYSGGGSTKWLIDLLKGFAWTGDDTASEVTLNVNVVEGMDVNETIIRIVEMPR